MNRHQLHFAFGFGAVRIGEQGHMGQVMGQGNFFAAGSFVFINGLLQLRYIVETFLAAFRAQHFFIAAFIQNGGKDLGNGAVFISGGVALYQ